MARIDKKGINARANTIDDAWKEKAPTVEFKGHKYTDLAALRSGIAADEAEAEDLRAQAKVKENAIADKYRALNAMSVDVRSGVSGHKDYGEDSPLYGAMGFIRKSERKTGLTHKKKNAENV